MRRKRAGTLAVAIAIAVAPLLPAAVDTGRRAEALTLTELDADAAALCGHVDFVVPDGAVSVLLTLALEEADHGIGLVRLSGPDGAIQHDTTFATDSWEALSHTSTITAEAQVGTGDVSLFLPASRATAPRPGRHRLAFELDPPGAPLSRVSLATRRTPLAGPIDELEHAIELRLSVFHTDRRYRGRAFVREVERDWRRALDAVLAPHRLRIGTIRTEVAARRPSRRFVALDEEESGAVCRQTRENFSAGGDAPALHVALVGEIVDAAESESWTSGLSAQPGAAFHADSPNGCVILAERPWREDEHGEPAPLSVESITVTLLHELGHFAGLAHTSEADGRVFDMLDDTPRCELERRDGGGIAGTEGDPADGVPTSGPSGSPAERDGIVDEFECADGGGADNVMFWTSAVGDGPWTFTPEQAWVLRRHPLFRPTRPRDALGARGAAPRTIGDE